MIVSGRTGATFTGITGFISTRGISGTGISGNAEPVDSTTLLSGVNSLRSGSSTSERVGVIGSNALRKSNESTLIASSSKVSRKSNESTSIASVFFAILTSY